MTNDLSVQEYKREWAPKVQEEMIGLRAYRGVAYIQDKCVCIYLENEIVSEFLHTLLR